MTLTPEQEAEIRANDAEFYADEIEPDSMMEQELAVNQHLLLAEIDRLRAEVERLKAGWEERLAELLTAEMKAEAARADADRLAEALRWFAGDELRGIVLGGWANAYGLSDYQALAREALRLHDERTP